ncbi:MAG: tRNA 4-thiouridine(8) synthase ThiI [Ruminococcaceae bacterium]|nr:tRNA 4-thiouridine(8) synthase ThiI [Oscillospiraceae bacterium]
MKEIILVKYGEIILKGGNRPKFEKKLLDNIRNSMKNVAKINMYMAQATVYIEPEEEDKIDIICERLCKIFGIVTVCKAAICEKNMDSIKKTAVEYCRDELLPGKKFKVEAKRSDKAFPLNSVQLAIDVGGYIHENVEGLLVDVHNPEVTVQVEVRDHNAFVYCREKRMMGQGGMPIGTGGKATLLLSGGIDSPVAGHMIAKRGIEIDAVNFFSFPYTSERAKEKVIELASIIARYTSKINLYIVPFTDIQLAIKDNCPEEHLTLIMRRFMMKISEIIASKNGSQALITGESAGQVASQTLAALHVTNSVCTMPVLRPLIGMDKTEIIERSQKIDAFETSILPYEDCCTVFTPRHPATNPKLYAIEKSESKLDVDRLIEEAVNGVEKICVFPKL